MQTNTLTLPVNFFEKSSLNNSVLFINKSDTSEHLLLLYNYLLDKFKQTDNADYQEKMLLFNKLKSILLANNIKLPRRVARISKLNNKNIQHKYCISKLDSFNTKKNINRFISKYVDKINSVDKRIRKYLKMNNLFPIVQNNEIISQEKYFSSLKRKYKKIVPFFNFVHNDEFVDDYKTLCKKMHSFYTQFESIKLFKHTLDCSEYDTIHTCLILLNKIDYLNSLVIKLERYSNKNKYNFEDVIELLENDIFDMTNLFDSKVALLKSSMDKLIVNT